MTKIVIIICFGLLLWLVSSLCYKRGKDAEQIRRLKEEIKQRALEEAYAKDKVDFVRTCVDVDERLSKIGSDKK